MLPLADRAIQPFAPPYLPLFPDLLNHSGISFQRLNALLYSLGIWREYCYNNLTFRWPAICVGDFNGTPDSEPIQILKSDDLLLDSREISKTPPYGTVGTTNQFNLNAPMKNRIDYIFVTKNIHVNKYGTLNEFQYGHYPSDHFPIMIEAEF